MIFSLKNFRTDPSTSKEPRRSSTMDVTPLEWNEFFDRKLSLDINGDVFCVYRKGDTGPMFYMLHGGGYSGLTWAAVTVSLSLLSLELFH